MLRLRVAHIIPNIDNVLEVNDYYENKNFVPVYTDGSKTDNYVSSSAVFPVDSFKVNLHEHTSIFTAEAVALKLAVQHIQRIASVNQ